jgi:hypothetical protein
MASRVSEHGHAGRFRLAYAFLLAIAVAGVAAFVFHGTGDSGRGGDGAPQTQWGNFLAQGLPSERVQEIAQYVGSSYRLPSGHQLVAVSVSIPPVYMNKLPITSYAVSYTAAGKTNYQVVPIGSNNVVYQLCGLGPRCAIGEGKATLARGRLLRREALELALYTFHYTDVSSVVTFLPPKNGDKPQWVFLFLRSQFEQEGVLSRPLSAILAEATPPPAAAIPPSEAATIDGLTEPDRYHFHYTSDQQGGVWLVFDPRALQ